MTARNPLITIVTITYNAEDCITATMKSLQQQSYRNFEHLIIDGASKDNTLKIAKELASAKTRIFSEPDKGLYDAMNKGLRKAAGKYILFLNAGDSFASAHSLEKYAEGAEEDFDIIYADTVLVDQTGNIVGPRHLSAPERLTKKSFSHGMLICHQAFMVKRGLAPEYDISYRFSADYDWTVKCIAATSPDRCKNLHGVHIHYLTDGLTDKNMKASLKERFRIMAHHYGFLPTLFRHLSFIPRFLSRKWKKKK